MTRVDRGDEGTTLVELLIAVAILGLSVTAIVGAMMTSIITTDVHRGVTTGETAVRSYAEVTKNFVAEVDAAGAPVNWERCPATYDPGFVPPTGFVDVAVTVEYWDGTAWDATCPAGTSDTVQRLTLAVTSDNGRGDKSTQIVVRKP